jgi:hypothetical protein
MVVMTEDGMLSAGVTHDESGFHPDAPFSRHRAIPQPNFVQVIPRTSRTQRGGVSPSTSTLRLKSFTLIACGIACTSRIASYRGWIDRFDFGAAGAHDNTRGVSTLQTLLSGVAGCGRSALLLSVDLDVRTVRIECHFNDVARGLCLWPGSRAGGSFA